MGTGSGQFPRPNGSPAHHVGQTSNGLVTGTPFGAFSRSGYATPDGCRGGVPPWTLARNVDFNDIFSKLSTSWAGELSCILPEVTNPQASFSEKLPDAGELEPANRYLPPNDGGYQADSELLPAGASRSASSSIGNQQNRSPPDDEIPPSLSGSREGPPSHLPNEDPTHLLQLFKKIHQPPAAILIGGFERWRRLQKYLYKLSEHSRAVNSSLLCVIELLMIEETAQEQGQTRETCMRRILERHALACQEIERKFARNSGLRVKLDTLDSKAMHLGREHLLAPGSLQVVSCYHTEITSSLQHDVVAASPRLGLGQVKQAVLHTILQPALGWYLTSQSYCRRISAHDKYHRKRFTSDDEFEVITACKQLKTELFELWEYRPVVLTMPIEQLMAVVSPDIAIRLDENFSTYLVSFWILFVYLHRVSWWHLPHSAVARRALVEVWRHMQRAYGEEVNGPLRKVIHPSLLWPLFLFGSECQNDEQRT